MLPRRRESSEPSVSLATLGSRVRGSTLYRRSVIARPLPWRLAPAAYPHHQTIQTRFQDMDVLGHLNNVAFASLFETGRTKFNHLIDLLPSIRERRSVVARVEINYLAEGSYPEDVEIGSGIGAIGGRSWDMLAAMFQGGQCIATCDATIVMGKAPDGSGMPAAFREELERWGVRQPDPSPQRERAFNP